MKNDFYKGVEFLDEIISKSKPSLTDIISIKNLLKNDGYQKYFYQNLYNPNMFDIVVEQFSIKNLISEPKPSFDGKHIQFPQWWPGKYLIRVADRIPNKVLLLIEKIKTENCAIIDDCSKAVLKMPDKFVTNNYGKIINLYDKWIGAKYVSRVKYEADDLFDKLIKTGCFDGALKLLDVLSKTQKDKIDVKLRFEDYYYKEIIKKHLSKLAEYNTIKLLSIIEARLKEAIMLETKDKTRKDYSIGWRPAIEDNEQNWDFDKPRDIFVDIIRDVLCKLFKEKSEDAKRIIGKYLNDSYSIFRRIGIHATRLSDFNDLQKKLLMDKSNLDKIEIYHEFFKLAQDKFNVLDSHQKKEFISWILEIPAEKIIKEKDKARVESYKRSWQARRLMMIKSYLETDNDVKEYKYLLAEFDDMFSRMEHPDLLSYSSSWTGPTSALSKDEIVKKSPEQFIDWVTTNLQPPYDVEGPSPEGVSRIFQEVVKEKAEIYAKDAERFINDKILPTYLCGLLHGLAGAIEAGKAFELEPIIRVIENPLKFHPELKIDSRHDAFDIGEYSWLRGTIANFIEALVMNDTFAITEDILNRTQNILIELIEKDEQPTEKDEKEYGKEANNMDYTTYCINSNRGKAMCALMQHALRRARMRPDEEKKKEEGKGPFPPGERMNLYKEFLTKRLDDEKSPSVQSSYGRFLPSLCYLDQGWVKSMIDNGKLFPKDSDKQKLWEANWEGYIGYHGLYSQFYDWLKEDYIKAVDNLSIKTGKKEKFERYDDRLAEHLMIAYWRELEDVSGDRIKEVVNNAILDKFFNNAPVGVRRHAIWFLATAIEEIKPKIDSPEWQRLRKLWEHRVRKCHDEELGSFVRWLKDCPEKISDIADLIKAIIPFLPGHFNEDTFFEYLLLKVDENPIVSLELLDQLLSIGVQTFLFENKVKSILDKAAVFKADSKTAQAINKVVNALGVMGYYRFRDLLVK